VGGAQIEIGAVEARQRETYNECGGSKENCGCATEAVGAGEGEKRLDKQRQRCYDEHPDHTSSDAIWGPFAWVARDLRVIATLQDW
jgi:hypothetical protein